MMSDIECDTASSNNNNKKRRLNDNDESDAENHNDGNQNDKDTQIQTLKRELKVMTEKYEKMKADNLRLRKKFKSTPAKSSTHSNTNNKQKTEKEIARMKKKYLKKWSTRLPKVAGMKKTKFIGHSKEIIVEEQGMDKADFDLIFGNKGYLVQPRPDNKPKSTVIIRSFASWEEIEPLFKEYGLTEEVTVSIWRNRSFSKSMFYGHEQAKVASLNVHFNKSRKVLQLKFMCERDFGTGFMGYF